MTDLRNANGFSGDGDDDNEDNDGTAVGDEETEKCVLKISGTWAVCKVLLLLSRCNGLVTGANGMIGGILTSGEILEEEEEDITLFVRFVIRLLLPHIKENAFAGGLGTEEDVDGFLESLSGFGFCFFCTGSDDEEENDDKSADALGWL